MPDARGGVVAAALADWAVGVDPSEEDLALAGRALADTVAVAIAGAREPATMAARSLGRAALWGVAAHVLDFDDLHVESTAHLSTVGVPVALGTGGGARAYLVTAGVMTRLADLLGWGHYRDGWHITCTTGALGAAAGAAVALGLDAERTAAAIALAVPGAGGVQAAFGADAKSLQVGFAIASGIRAAGLAARGVTANGEAVDQWVRLMGGSSGPVRLDGPAVPGRLAAKLFPCCYALQRPIQAIWSLGDRRPDPARVREVVVRAPAATVAPLIHHRPSTGLEGKFSLEYGVATALIDGFPSLPEFTDEAVRREDAQRIIPLVRSELESGGASLLDGRVSVAIRTYDAREIVAELVATPEIVFEPEAWRAKLESLAPGWEHPDWDRAAADLEAAIPVDPR